jgi:EAL domain-containing protein (putative c-di-GMP-specific phosphodiesterase class I)
VGRKDADKFLFYAPHDTDYEAFLKELTAQMGVGNENARMHIRLGIFSNADAEPHIELRFDRAKMAGDHIKNDYSRQISYYDQELFSKELFDSQLMDDFERGLKEKQFEVWYQPKFDVKGDKPRLSSAECLIRWRHPKFGMVSPGVFIPLFERSGLIQRLDRYVWEEAARQVAQWRDSYGFTLPVSVNVSRIDMYAPDFVEFFTELMKREKLSPETYFIEITESAYTQDSDQMAAMVTALRDQGFKVEMDDFGSGYSSLNMLANLPIDFIKMDMQFVRSMDVNKKSLRMIELILDIASYLQLPVIAEGVETEQQVKVLKELGCYIIQGYYFSKPLPAAEFEKFIKEAKENA